MDKAGFSSFVFDILFNTVETFLLKSLLKKCMMFLVNLEPSDKSDCEFSDCGMCEIGHTVLSINCVKFF